MRFPISIRILPIQSIPKNSVAWKVGKEPIASLKIESMKLATKSNPDVSVIVNVPPNIILCIYYTTKRKKMQISILYENEKIEVKINKISTWLKKIFMV